MSAVWLYKQFLLSYGSLEMRVDSAKFDFSLKVYWLQFDQDRSLKNMQINNWMPQLLRPQLRWSSVI